MRSFVTGSLLALGLAGPLLAAATVETPPPKGAAAWRGCCGLPPWAEPGPMKVQPHAGGGVLFQGYRYIVGGSPLRHHLGTTGEIPAAYAKLSNPLAPTTQNAERGAAVYEANCASCHGETGLGDGPASRTLNPPPAHLGWLTKVPSRRRDAFMYWAVAEGGAPFSSGMPGYKDKLTDPEIWSVIGYVEARLPPPQAAR